MTVEPDSPSRSPDPWETERLSALGPDTRNTLMFRSEVATFGFGVGRRPFPETSIARERVLPTVRQRVGQRTERPSPQGPRRTMESRVRRRRVENQEPARQELVVHALRHGAPQEQKEAKKTKPGDARLPEPGHHEDDQPSTYEEAGRCIEGRDGAFRGLGPSSFHTKDPSVVKHPTRNS